MGLLIWQLAPDVICFKAIQLCQACEPSPQCGIKLPMSPSLYYITDRGGLGVRQKPPPSHSNNFARRVSVFELRLWLRPPPSYVTSVLEWL